MDDRVTFDRSSAERIADVVRRVETTSIGMSAARNKHKTRGQGGSSDYAGPFAVVKKDDTTVTILGHNVDEGRNWWNYVYAGLTSRDVEEQDKGSLGADSGYLYLDITYSDGYSVAVGYGAPVPYQSSTHYYHPLAWIECANSKISSITQLQYGQIFIAGRVV